MAYLLYLEQHGSVVYTGTICLRGGRCGETWLFLRCMFACETDLAEGSVAVRVRTSTESGFRVTNIMLTPLRTNALDRSSAIRSLTSSPTRPTVSVVIPTLNEARNLPFVVNTIPPLVDEIIVVDGHSHDDTTRVARTLDPRVHVVVEARRGKGAALTAGVLSSKGDIIVLMDGDGSMNGHEIPRFVEILCAGADYVKGSRFLPGAASVDITRIRRLGDAGLCIASRVLFGARFSDATYGFRAVWRHVLDAVNLDPAIDGFEAELLLDARMLRHNVRVAEVPCVESRRIFGSSNLRALPDGWRCLRVLLRERFRAPRKVAPAMRTQVAL